jgi:plasmid stability protein
MLWWLGFPALTAFRAVGAAAGHGRQVLALIADWGWLMAAVSIRNLDDDVKERLRMRAASHGRSMESEIRAILVEAVTEPDQHRGMLVTLMERFGDLGGVDLEIPARTTPARAADLSA